MTFVQLLETMRAFQKNLRSLDLPDGDLIRLKDATFDAVSRAQISTLEGAAVIKAINNVLAD